MSDRVDHTEFGLGVVSAPPQGDRCEVTFDNPACGQKHLARRFLSLVTRPDAKGGPYWANQFATLLNTALDQRRKTDETMKHAFRSANEISIDATTLRRKLEEEKAGIAALLAFLDADEAGDHP